MAEAVALAASVAGLVSLGLQTTEYLYRYYTAYRDRNEDICKTTRRLGVLSKTLTTINEVLQSRKGRPDEDTILQSIYNAFRQSEEIIQDLQDEVQKLQKEPTSKITKVLRAFRRRAAYPFQKATLANLDKDVGAFNDNLVMALQALNFKEHQNTQQDIEKLRTVVDVGEARNLTAEVCQWLKAPDATLEYNAACEKRHPGTGQWFLQSAAFTTWLKRDNSFLWLYGFSGTGKSVLCSAAVEHIFHQQRVLADCAIAYFFFTYSDETKRDKSALLKALLLQLSNQIPSIGSELRKLQEKDKHGSPPEPALMNCLQQAVSRASHMYILVDALDECPMGTARDGVLKTIQTLRQWSIPGLHLLATSQDLHEIRDNLQIDNPAQDGELIALNDDRVKQDIQNYVTCQVDHDVCLQRWGDHREKIKDDLTRGAQGVFRWVDCQLPPLRKGPYNVRILQRRLRQLPQSLPETYERMLCNIDAVLKDEARRVLALLCCSPRPMLVAEIIGALTISLDENEGSDSEQKFEAEDLLRICPGIVEIGNPPRHSVETWNKNVTDNGLSTDSTTMQDQVIRLAHPSVQQYLTSEFISGGHASFFAISDGREHSMISHICLLYLRNPEFLGQTLTPELVRQHPFAKFAAKHWHYHYRQGDSSSIKPSLSDVVDFLTTDATRKRWVMLDDPDRPWNTSVSYGDSGEDQPAASAVYYVALLGLDGVLASILALPRIDINIRGGLHGTALQAASAGGHEKAVQMLLDNGADLNVGGDHFGSALQTASVRGHEKVVEILLGRGADANVQGGMYGNALQAASCVGHEKIVQTLLRHDAAIDRRGGFYGTALQAASARGHERVVQALLNEGADVNVGGGHYATALQAASHCGHEVIVSMLLAKGADINAAAASFHGNALQAAATAGHERVVQLLLQHGVHHE